MGRHPGAPRAAPGHDPRGTAAAFKRLERSDGSEVFHDSGHLLESCQRKLHAQNQRIDAHRAARFLIDEKIDFAFTDVFANGYSSSPTLMTGQEMSVRFSYSFFRGNWTGEVQLGETKHPFGDAPRRHRGRGDARGKHHGGEGPTVAG